MPIQIFRGGANLVFPQLAVSAIREYNRGSCIIMLVMLFCTQALSSGMKEAGSVKEGGIPQKYLRGFSIHSWSIAEGLPQSTIRRF